MSSGDQLTADSLRPATVGELHDLQMKVYGSLALGDIAEVRTAQSCFSYEDTKITVQALRRSASEQQQPTQEFSVELACQEDAEQMHLRTTLPYAHASRAEIMLNGRRFEGTRAAHYGVVAAQFALQVAELNNPDAESISHMQSVMQTHRSLRSLLRQPPEALVEQMLGRVSNPTVESDPLGVSQPAFFDDVCATLRAQPALAFFKHIQERQRPLDGVAKTGLWPEIVRSAVTACNIVIDCAQKDAVHIVRRTSEHILGHPVDVMAVETCAVEQAADTSLSGSYTRRTQRSIPPQPHRLADYQQAKRQEAQMAMQENHSGPVRLYDYERMCRALQS